MKRIEGSSLLAVLAATALMLCVAVAAVAAEEAAPEETARAYKVAAVVEEPPVTAATAAEGTTEEAAAPAQAAADTSQDKTGTNPVNFQNELRLYNVFTSLPDGNYQNLSVFRYIMPFNNRTMNIRLDLPLVTTDVTGDTEFGFGDLNLRWLWTAKQSRTHAVAVGIKSWWDTATGDALGSGKNALAPVVSYVMFLNRQTIFAPAYQYKFDIGGSDDRPDISQSFIDFYYVYLPKPGQGIVVDPTIIIDHDRSKTSMQVEVELGRMISPGMSTYIRPGFPIGGNRLIDWNLEVGVKTVF